MRRKDWRIVSQWVRASVMQDGRVLQICCTAMCIYISGGSAVKNLPAMQEMQQMQVRSLGWEDHLDQEMATHSRILAWRIPWTEEPGGLQSMGTQRVGHHRAINTMATNTNVYIVSKSVPYTQKLLRR